MDKLQEEFFKAWRLIERLKRQVSRPNRKQGSQKNAVVLIDSRWS